MQRTMLPYVVMGVLLVDASVGRAQSPVDTLTAERVVALARARSPQIRIAESAVMEARGRLAGARALATTNPTIEGVAATDERFEQRTQWELSVPIGIGPNWFARRGTAQAELERDQQLLSDVRRGAVAAALAAYYRVLHASRRVELAGERVAVADELRRSAVERHRTGEVPRLEVLLTETESVRAQSDLLAEEQSLARERVHMAARLGLPSGERLVMAGDLADRSWLAATLNGQAPARRADVLAADRELRAARGAKSLARADLFPGLAFRLNYGHEGGDPLVQPGLAVTVPLFNRGQDTRQLAAARESRARAELERVEGAAAAESEGLSQVFDMATRAADSLTVGALPRVAESEGMVREGYRAGKIDLPALLVVRANLLETRREILDRQLDAALAGIDLAEARGHFQQ